jgi:hypothetical protein
MKEKKVEMKVGVSCLCMFYDEFLKIKGNKNADILTVNF